MRLLWLLGLIPFVAADYAVAFSIGQIPIAVQELSGDVTCSLNDFQTSLETSDWQRANEILADCDFATMHESDVRSWFDKPRDVIQAAQQQQQDATSPDIIQAAQRQQIIAFHALRQIQQSARHVAASEGFIDWLVGQVTALGANETQDQDLNAALQAIAAETLGLFITTIIERAEAIEVYDDPERIYFSVPPDSSVDTAPISALLALTSDSPNSLSVNLAALQALREIGRALQIKVDETRLAEAGNQDRDHTTWHHHRFWADVVRTLENQISAEEQLFTVVQVARVEALSAFLFVSFDNQEQAYKPDELAARLCPIDFITSESDIQINRGIQFLTCLSAQAEWEGASGETVEIDSAVRAAAIAELERLATIPTFRRELARQLQNLALQWEQRQRQANQDLSQDEALLNAQQTLRLALGISAVESYSRVGSLPDPPQPQLRDIGEQGIQAQQEQRYFTDTSDDRVSSALLSLLAEGLDDSNNGNGVSELRQRAEIAFGQIYGRDLNLLLEAMGYADGSGSEAIQKNVVAALGAVNYRELKSAGVSDDLEPVAQFLGQSLFCDEDAEVRRDAAFALGQLAPYYPDLLNLEQVPFQYRLAPDPDTYSPPESWGQPLVDICQAMAKIDNAESPQVDGESPKIIDALMLRLSDREENIVVAAAYALSQYGIALESDRNQTEFLRPVTNEAPQADSRVSDLKICMMALVSPTRYDAWPDQFPEDLPDHWPENRTYPSLQSLVEKTEEYVEACPYLLPEQNQNESSISAAFVLGQVGISDGEFEASDEEREIVAHLLRSLAGRDLLAQLAVGASPPSQVTAVTSLQEHYPYRDDSVRDAIVSYALGQIHPREDALIQNLISAILFEQPLDSAARPLSCAGVVPNGNEDYFACIEDPVTRASVVGAIEVIGLETNEQAEQISDRRRERIIGYVRKLRQLLTQDVSPVLTETVLSSVIERIVLTSGQLLDEAAPEPNNVSPELEREFAISQNVLGESLTSIYASIYSCAGASYGLARLGVNDTTTINQLVHYLYSFPEPLTQLAPIPEQLAEKAPSRFQGNFCVLALPEADVEQTSDDLPSRLEQLVIFKTGAIAALGAIRLNTFADRHDGASEYPLEDQLIAPLDLLDADQANLDQIDHDVKNVVACLVDIANLEMLAFHESSTTSCDQVFASKEPAIQERPSNHNDFPDTELSQDERSRVIRAGLVTRLIDEGQEWGLTADEMIQAHELEITMVDRAYAKLHDVPIDFLREGLGKDTISLSVDDLIRAWRFGIRSVDEFLDGRRRGLLTPEVIQAAKWGLTPQEFFILKVRLQEPAIAAIGQLAIIEAGGSDGDFTALKALSLKEQEDGQQVTGRSRANLQGLSPERIKILKLRNLEAVLQALQGLPGEPEKKIEYIIDRFLIDELTLDQDGQSTENNSNQLSRIISSEERLSREEAFRDEVLKVLVSLESETISRLSPGTRERLITELGIGRRPERLAQQCLSAADDLFTQERLCYGLARLLTAALNPNYEGSVSPEAVDTSTGFLQTLATDPDQETERANRFNSSRSEIERSSSVIRASGIEYLGQLEIGYASSPALPNILLARLADEDEQVGVIEHAIQTYYASDPETGVRSLMQVLNSDDGNIAAQQAAARMVARLGQRAYSNPDAIEDEPIAIDDIPNLGVRRADNNDYQWQIALQNEALVAVLMRIAGDPETSNELKADAIAALGSIRTTNASAIDLIRRTLLDTGATLEIRIAAAYALGQIGQSNQARVGELQVALLNVVRGNSAANNAEATEAATEANNEETNQLSDDEANQLRTVAAFALSQLNADNALNRLQQFEVVYALVALFREIQGASPEEGEPLVSFNTRRALILAALGQFELDGIVNSGGSRPSLAERNLLERVAETYAAGISAGNPLAVRVMAVARARSLPVWSDDLVSALIAATQDANPAIRLAAVETIQFRQAEIVERSIRFDVLEQGDALFYKQQLVEALAAVFWDSQEYGIIRLPAGRALDNELERDLGEQETLADALEALDINPESPPFADILVALDNLEEFSASFRDSSGFLRGSDAILQALRSDSLLAQLDPLFSEQLLFEILEAIRDDPSRYPSASRRVRRSGPSAVCSLFRIFCR